MAQPISLEAQLQELPQDQQQMAARILESIPQAHRPAAQRLLGQIAALPSARDALIHLESIVRSDNFQPSYLGTLSLIAQRGGSNVTSALSEFERLIELPKFNRHVARTARLAVLRAGENSHEAIRGLYFLVSNPSFTPNSLTIALPDRFLAFLEQAIRNSGDAPHLSIRAMGSMFANSRFTPSDLTRREAGEFGQVLRQVQTWSRTNSLYAMDALCSLLANSAIRPQDISATSARELGTLVNIVVEYTRAIQPQTPPSEGSMVDRIRQVASAPSSSREQPPLTIDETMRRFNLIMGHSGFRMGMISGTGLLNRAINDSVENVYIPDVVQNVPDVVQSFYTILRQSRRRPELMALTTHLMGQREEMNMDPLAILEIVGTLASNPRLAPLLSRADFPQRLESMLTTLGSSLQTLDATESLRQTAMRGSHIERLYMIPLLEMLGRDNFTPEAFGMLEEMVGNLSLNRESGERGEGSVDIGLYLMNAALSRPNARPNQRLFRDIAALARQLRERTHTDYSTIAELLSSRFFRPDMLTQPTGIIPYLIRMCPPSNLPRAADQMRLVMERLGNGSQVLNIFRQIIRFGGRDTSTAFFVLQEIAVDENFSRRNYAALLELLRRSGRYTYFALNLYSGLMTNPNLRSSLRSEEYMQRVARLIIRSRGSESADARLAVRELTSIMRNPGFRPEMIEQLEYISRVSGPYARHVFSYITSMLENDEVVLAPLLNQKFIRYLAGMARIISTYGGRHEGDMHHTFGSYLSREGLGAAEEVGNLPRIRRSYEALMRAAGPDISSDALMAYFISIRHFVLSEEDSETMGRFIRQELSGLEGGERQERIEHLSTMFGSLSPEMIEFAIENPALYRRGRALARNLIPGCNDPAIYLNFAYGIQNVGQVMVTDLYRSYGMRYFARYSDDVLEQMHESIGGAEKPPILVIFPHSDYNGAFYQEAEELDALVGRFNVIVYERADEDGFYDAVRDFRRRFGQTGTIIIGGHGTPTTITLGEGNEAGQLDLSDRDELAELQTVLRPNGTVILDSCSTGASASSIGALISRVLGATLYAPTVPGNISHLSVSQDGTVSATYTVRRRRYSAGTPVSGE